MSVHLKQDKPDTRNVLDTMAQGVIGADLPRPEGLIKVTGTAIYAAEYRADGMLEGVLVTAPVVRGEIASINEASVLGMPGVRAVISDKRMTGRPAQGTAGEAPFQPAREVCYWGQPVALVVAETFEQARDAAKRLALDWHGTGDAPLDPEAAETEKDESTRKGDLAHAMAEAAHTVDVTITTEGHASAAMEPHAALAQWDGRTLTVHASLQMLKYNRAELADSLKLEEEQVRLVSPYVGGGFGSKLGISQEVVAASLAAMQLGRPVRVVMSRQQVFQTIMRRSETRQRIRLAADAEGRLTGFGHEALVSNLPGEDFAEPVLQSSQFLYGGDNRLLKLDLARIHRMTAGSVRAPGEAVGVQTVEQAMDILAEKLGMDPIALRLRNLPDAHPAKGTPFSSRKLAECLEEGAKAFGWEPRPRAPRHTREGEWWIGTGVASAARVHAVVEAKARVTLRPDRTALVETDMTDIGTGTYTILGQIAGEMLGLMPDDIDVRLGDTDFPPGSGSGGSWGAPSCGSAVFLACEGLRKDIARRLDIGTDDLTLKDGLARWDGGETALADILGGEPLDCIGHFEPGSSIEDATVSSFGAFFAEVAVNRWTGETRVRRMTGAFGIGRVLSARTARSQCLGGMTWCIGNALTESLMFDPVDGHLANCDLAEYHVPVHRDVPALEVLLLEERDAAASPIQAKGVGELGLCGGAGAIANAIYDACGARVFAYPMTPDRVIAAMPDI
ncbi:xanthine dehydrogenase family protein molybdopterin-binding subunit [Erythrobacter sp. WG]|uniref:xanthine dehydrogenase family protein molybdopterin-binding subunit n=1 Tax=Erythrobacter sp. WG TaxID=2985510 RepID=UPI00226D4783|nr:xanthine dehydrogenase family protein molybdopterin-binding subunit [Erythrobacter sp. WG]MCX9147447.1 xanthine dehydrogenase family protein molybdopterin-binding subunit [Erythrobacter sp. WG]